MQQFTAAELEEIMKRHLEKIVADRRSQPDLLLAMMSAQTYLRTVVGPHWYDDVSNSQHTKIAPQHREGREFLRADRLFVEKLNTIEWQDRLINFARLIFSLQSVEGIDERIEALRAGHTESCYAEFEAGAYLLRKGIKFRFLSSKEATKKIADIEIQTSSGKPILLEAKAKMEETDVSAETIRQTLKAACKQLPRDDPSLIFLRIPEKWTVHPDGELFLIGAIGAFLENTSRKCGVILYWHMTRTDPATDATAIAAYDLFRISKVMMGYKASEDVAVIFRKLDEQVAIQPSIFISMASRLVASQSSQ